MGGDAGKTPGASTASLGGSTTQDVWGTQTPFLQNLYQQGQALSQQPSPLLNQSTVSGQQYAQQVPGQVYNPLAGSYQQAFGPESAYNQAASRLTDPLVQGLTDIVSTQGPTFGAGGSNPLLDQNVAMALEQASQNFQRNVAPSIKREAIAQGQFGGSRGDLALGTAAGEANEAALRQAMQAYGDQYAADRAANLQSQLLSNQLRLGAGQQIQDILGAQAGNVGLGAQTGGQLVNLGLAPSDIYGQLYQNQWLPAQMQQQVLGTPTVLGGSQFAGESQTDKSESIFAPWQSMGGLGDFSSGGGGMLGGLPGAGSDLNPLNW